MEHISPFIRPPQRKLEATAEILQGSKEEAATAHQRRINQISQHLLIYTDRSGHNGHIGTAIFLPTINVNNGEYIGMDDIHNVYAAELTAILH